MNKETEKAIAGEGVAEEGTTDENLTADRMTGEATAREVAPQKSCYIRPNICKGRGQCLGATHQIHAAQLGRRLLQAPWYGKEHLPIDVAWTHWW